MKLNKKMLVTKTPCRNMHLAALARINDQLCFFLFADSELHPALVTAATARMSEFTPQVFPSNPYSKRINVTISELEAFRTTQLTQTLGMSFASAVEQLLLYIENAMLHWADANQLKLNIKEPIEDCLASFYKTTVGKALAPKIIKTLKYLRLRRNHYIHLNEKLSAELSKLLKYDATDMQIYWLSRTSIPGVEFESNAVTSFLPDETISLIKIMRICIEDIDGYLTPHIDARSLIKGLDAKLLTENPRLRDKTPKNLEKRIRKIGKRAEELYGINGTAKEIANALGITL